MSAKKSKPYEIGGSKYSFNFVGGKLVGIQKADENGQFGNSLENEYLNPKLSTFGDIAATDEALNAYNTAKYGSNKNGYEDSVTQATSAELQDYFNEQGKKATNQAAILEESNSVTNGDFLPSNPVFRGAGNNKNYKPYAYTRDKGELYAYPSDISTDQDHLKIQKWEYVRPNINQSKPNQGAAKQDQNVAGDSVKGSRLQGSVLLPMPKVVDVNGADWGENKITAFGLAALGGAEIAGKLVGLTPGLTNEERERQRESLKSLRQSGQSGAGFGSSKELDEDNLKLSEARAKSVMDHLVSQKVPARMLTSKGYGESQPVVPNTSEESRALNRRVEFRVSSIK